MDDHPGLAAEYERTLHPTLWSVAHFDWFSDEYTVMGTARSKAGAEALKVELLRQSPRMKPDDLVVLAPQRRSRRASKAAGSEP